MKFCEYHPTHSDEECGKPAVYLVYFENPDIDTFPVCVDCFRRVEANKDRYPPVQLDVIGAIPDLKVFPDDTFDALSEVFASPDSAFELSGISGEASLGSFTEGQSLQHYVGHRIQKLFDIHHACEHYIETAQSVLDTEYLEDDVYVQAEANIISALAVMDLTLTKYLEDELLDTSAFVQAG